ncbi:MAG: hypothetical protein HYV28_12530 [Ignavibacteriales bacterium]|nr:hypothetical protein [Ignavibacteriales bacterium]
MLKRMTTVFLAFLFAGTMLAQNQPMKKAPVIVHEPNVAPTNVNIPNVIPKQTTAAAWKLVDSMGNIYGPAIGTINPLAYDPYSNVAAIIHRSTSAFGGSGMVYYNISTNKGVTWTRVNAGINAASSLTARYPSMAIANPTKSANIADAYAVFAWPALGNGAFDWVGYGFDTPIGQAAPFAGVIDHDGAYSSQTPIWANPDNNKILWTAEYLTPDPNNPIWQGRLFATTDYSTVTASTPAPFRDSSMGGMIIFGGVSKGNTVFVAGAASGVDNFAVPMVSGWCPVVAKSTDNGVTWSDWIPIDFRAIPSLSAYDRLFDYKKGDTFISYGGDLNIDMDGRVHIVTALTDTTIDNNTGKNAIVEIYQTASGWDGKVIFEGINDQLFTWCAAFDPALGQMGASPYIAASKAGDVFACQWVNGTSVTDTCADIFISIRPLNGNWSVPQNLTQTPNMNENSSHLAPYLEGSETNYTAFSNFSYEKGNTTSRITQTNVASLYCAGVPLTLGGSGTITWESTINVKENGTTAQNLVFGFAPTATNGIDLSLGEAPLPPVPPAGVFDARLELPLTPPDYSIKDYRNDTNRAAIWTIKFQPGTGGYPFTLSWNPATLPLGTFIISDNITGTIINANMKTSSSVSVTNSGITALVIKYSKQICKDVALLSGWNMFGIPVASTDMTAATMFPAATSPVYGYSAGYFSATTLVNGKGYWVRYPSATAVNVCGSPVALQTIALSAGWNMITVYDNDAAVSALTTTPAGIINSPFYGFNSGYSTPTTLLAGKGYWVRATQAGTLNLPTSLIKSEPSATTSIIDSKWSYLRISDAEGNTQSLYFAADAKDLTNYELPPVPPAGIFDARFASNGNVESISATQQIMISSAEYPVTVKAEKASFVLRDAATHGKVINMQLSAGQNTVIYAPVSMIEAEAVQMPVEFALEQNYPNPFNPSTTFRFSLPAKANVSLVVFNQLGEKVAEVLGNELEAGKHQIYWSAEKLSS